MDVFGVFGLLGFTFGLLAFMQINTLKQEVDELRKRLPEPPPAL
jgi:hypothetical protein